MPKVANPVLPGFNPDSGGVWAPCLSHADGQFWLIYTDVKRKDGAFAGMAAHDLNGTSAVDFSHFGCHPLRAEAEPVPAASERGTS